MGARKPQDDQRRAASNPNGFVNVNPAFHAAFNSDWLHPGGYQSCQHRCWRSNWSDQYENISNMSSRLNHVKKVSLAGQYLGPLPDACLIAWTFREFVY